MVHGFDDNHEKVRFWYPLYVVWPRTVRLNFGIEIISANEKLLLKDIQVGHLIAGVVNGYFFFFGWAAKIFFFVFVLALTELPFHRRWGDSRGIIVLFWVVINWIVESQRNTYG